MTFATLTSCQEVQLRLIEAVFVTVGGGAVVQWVANRVQRSRTRSDLRVALIRELAQAMGELNITTATFWELRRESSVKDQPTRPDDATGARSVPARTTKSLMAFIARLEQHF